MPIAMVMLVAFLGVAPTLTIFGANAETQTRIFTYSYGGLTVQVTSPLEAYPNVTAQVGISARALTSLTLNRTVVEFYTFNESVKEETMFGVIEFVNETSPVQLLGGESINETSYEVTIPEFASNVVYGKLLLLWTEKGTDESTIYERGPTFITLYIRSAELEHLRESLPALEQENSQLKGNIMQLNDTLNGLAANLTDTKNRYEGELGGTRNAVAVLGITALFFAAATAYMFLRKPKEYRW